MAKTQLFCFLTPMEGTKSAKLHFWNTSWSSVYWSCVYYSSDLKRLLKTWVLMKFTTNFLRFCLRLLLKCYKFFSIRIYWSRFLLTNLYTTSNLMTWHSNCFYLTLRLYQSVKTWYSRFCHRWLCPMSLNSIYCWIFRLFATCKIFLLKISWSSLFRSTFLCFI